MVLSGGFLPAYLPSSMFISTAGAAIVTYCTPLLVYTGRFISSSTRAWRFVIFASTTNKIKLKLTIGVHFFHFLVVEWNVERIRLCCGFHIWDRVFHVDRLLLQLFDHLKKHRNLVIMSYIFLRGSKKRQLCALTSFTRLYIMPALLSCTPNFPIWIQERLSARVCRTAGWKFYPGQKDTRIWRNALYHWQ